jgi:hypothetical protein
VNALETIEVFVEAQAAFQIGEQAVHRHARAIEARRAALDYFLGDRFSV